MARKQDAYEDDGLPRMRNVRRKRSIKKRYALPLLFVGLLLVLLGIAPSILTKRAILLPLIDRYAGIAPLRVDFTSVSAGWFSPVRVEGLRLIDAQGQDVVKLAAIETEKSLLSWITASQNLGRIQIRDVQMDVLVANGTSSLEQALAPLVQSPEASQSPSATTYAGLIELTEARIALRDVLHPDVWVIAIPSFKTQLPGPNQLVGPTQLSAAIADSVGQSSGKVAADVAESTAGEVRTFNLRAVVDQVPLAFWHVVRQRFPELPIDDLSGTISARLAGSLVDQDRWSFNIESLSGDRLIVTAPALLGEKPARLESIKLQGQAALSGGVLSLHGTQLTSDVGGVTAAGTLTWPLTLPTLTEPWLRGAQFESQGQLDLARLVAVAQSLVPMKEDTRLMAGSASFKVSQQVTASGAPLSKADVQLGKLVAMAAGQELKWDDALKLSISAQPQASGAATLGATCDAEFCKITASGNAAEGAFSGQVDLDRLQQRLAQWIVLPVREMAGQASVRANWSQAEPGLVVAEGQLETTPLTVSMSAGGQLREPAWKGDFSATARLSGTQVGSLERGRLELTAAAEKLKFDLLEPLQLMAQNAPPAAFTLSSEGSLDLWQKRAVMLKILDTSTTLDGQYSLGASGRIDLAHLELREANWRSQPFAVGSGGTSLVEPEMVGNFQGNVNTNDLSQLAVEKLIVQTHSFSVSAADKANGSADAGRTGTGAYILDVGTLMRNIKSAPGATTSTQLVLPPGAGAPPAVPQSQLAFKGQVSGNLQWQVDAKAASLNMDAKSDQVDVIQQITGAQPVRLWSEAQLMANVKAIYDMASGDIKIDTMQFQSPWVHYAGTAQIENKENDQIIRASGQCLYDAAMVATKLQPYIGNHVQLTGRKQVPVEIVLVNSSKNATMLAGLQAATRLGWEQARVVGIDVGNADVPVSVVGGQLSTNAEFAVSGGKLRWDVQSDLTADQTVLIQKPMTVLENVAITPQMCQGWLKYVTPLIAEATSVDGRLSLTLNQARFNVANPQDQTIDGQLVIHSAVVGPGPLSNQVIGLVQQINAIRKRELASTVSATPQVWMQMPQQAIAFRMENGRVTHRDLRVNVGDVTLVSSGAVGIDGRLDVATAMPIPDDWVDKSPLLAGFRGQSLQFPVRGSLTAPQMDTQFVRDLGRQAIGQAAEGLIQQQLSRGLNKFLPGGVPQPSVPGSPASGGGGQTGGGLGLPQLGLPNLGIPNLGLPQFGTPPSSGQNSTGASGQNSVPTGN